MKQKRRIRGMLAVVFIIFCMIPGMFSLISNVALADESVVSRDDGTWYWPVDLPIGTLSDWAGCSNRSCPFHPGVVHYQDKYHYSPHNGIDIPVGDNSNVYAASRGKIVYYGYDEDRGNWMVMEHIESNTGNSYYTVYQHLSSSNLPVSDTIIEPGTVIAKSGHEFQYEPLQIRDAGRRKLYEH